MSPAAVTALGTIVGALISGLVSLIVASKQHSKSMALIEYRLSQLESKVDKHNNLVERMYVVETELSIMRKSDLNGKQK